MRDPQISAYRDTDVFQNGNKNLVSIHNQTHSNARESYATDGRPPTHPHPRAMPPHHQRAHARALSDAIFALDDPP
jgi:hypothetical protein